MINDNKMDEDSLIILQSPNGDITLANNKKPNNNINNNTNNNINNNNNYREPFYFYYFDTVDFERECELQFRRFSILTLCFFEVFIYGSNIVFNDNYKILNAINFVYSGYGFYSAHNFNKTGVLLYFIYRLVIFACCFSLFIFNIHIITFYDNNKVVPNNYFTILFTQMMNSLFQYYFLYSTYCLYNLLPMITLEERLNNEERNNDEHI